MNIHFIGICGVGMGALAIAFHKNGHTVTGSDVGFYPPISTYLKNAGVNYYAGWHSEKMGTPDLVVVGNVAGSSNSEWQYVQEKNLPFVSYPELIAKYLIAPNSVVCAGTFGKTTSTTILSWILEKSGMHPNYMFGGLCSDPSFPAAQITKGAQWSVVEGDEYKTARWDDKAKFFHYSPTHLLLTATVWDHADIYPTEALYIDAFQSLMNLLPAQGTIILSEKVTRVAPQPTNTIIRYGSRDGCDFIYSNIKQNKNGTAFDITHAETTTHIHTSMLGDFTADNMTGCFAMARHIGIPAEIIIQALETFPGIKRRMERRYSGDIDIYDDIAHSPTKAKAVLESIRKLYTGKVYAIFEPNTGNRKKESFPAYGHAFAAADEVIIPKLTSVKIAKDDVHPPCEGKTLADVIARTHTNTRYMPEDDALVSYLKTMPKKGDCIIFLGSHGFRGMIDELTKQ